MIMFRTFILSLTALGLSSVAHAHPDPEVSAPQTPEKITKPQLPTQAEIQNALEQMPDMNAIMGDMKGLVKDEKFQNTMKKSAKAFTDKMDKDDVFKTGPDGLPDFNKAFGAMLGAFSDEEAMGGMIDTMMGLAETMEKHIPQDAKKAAPKP